MTVLGYLMPGSRETGDSGTPSLTIIIPTFNEKSVVADRFKNLDTLSYPRNKLQIIFVDSGSTDGTYELIEKLATESDLDCLALRQETRRGKASAVNFAIQHAHGDIILVSDANALFAKDSMEKVVQPFGREDVGGAGGRFITLGGSTVGSGEELYWSIEDKIRRAESTIYSITNFSGEINSFRRSLGIVLDEKALAEDLDLTLQIIRKGYKVKYVPDAVVYEPSVENTHDLVKQKKRRAVGTLQVIFKHIGMYADPKIITFNIIFFVHKVLRVFTPLLAVLLLILLAVLFTSADFQYLWKAAGLIILISAIAVLISEIIFKKRLLRYVYYFIMVQYSYILAWYEFLTGRYKVTWEKTDSSRDLKNVINKVK